MATSDTKPVVYQVFTRNYSNTKGHQKFSGTGAENGVGKFNDYTDQLLLEIKSLGTTHIWFTGIIDHATSSAYPDKPASPAEILKGRAGSPYAIRDYYDVAPDLAENYEQRMEEFTQLVTRCHNHNLKVIIDFIPNHLARCYHSLQKPAGVSDFGETDDKNDAFHPNNNFYYLAEKFTLPKGVAPFGKGVTWKKTGYKESPAKATGNDCFLTQPGITDWYETVKLNYGVDYQHQGETHFNPIPDTWKKMLHIISFWASKGVDAFRCDMAEMVPIQFWRWLIPQVKCLFPHLLFIAEVYQKTHYHEFVHENCFNYLYDKVGLFDTLRAIMEGKATADSITACLQENGSFSNHMMTFIENHDEQRVASSFYANSAEKGIPAMAVAALTNSGAVLCYGGQELGEKGAGAVGFSANDGKSTIFDYRSLPTYVAWRKYKHNKQLRSRYATLLHSINSYTPFTKGYFYDLMWVNRHNPLFDSEYCYAFLRYDQHSIGLVVSNFSDKKRVCHILWNQHVLETIKVEGNITCFNPKTEERREYPIATTIDKGIAMTIERYDYSVLFIERKECI